MRTNEELKRLQSLPLADKVALTEKYITEWYEQWGGKVYISISGGKDSSCLAHIVHSLYPDVPAVFCDTGLEFPEVRDNALSISNVVVLKPEADFREVIKEHGWVFPSKDVALTIYYAKRGSEWAIQRLAGLNKDGTLSPFKKSRYVKWKLKEARDSYQLRRLEKTISGMDLLLLDELSYARFSQEESELLFKVIAERSERSSTMITTNLEFSKWTEMFSNATLVAALVDRLTYHSHVLNMNGNSYRLQCQRRDLCSN